jgi:hypothetical protein
MPGENTVPLVWTGPPRSPMTSDPSPGSLAMYTLYLNARGTALHLRISGTVGNVTGASEAGPSSSGAVDHDLTSLRSSDQRPAFPFASMPRTRQK